MSSIRMEGNNAREMVTLLCKPTPEMVAEFEELLAEYDDGGVADTTHALTVLIACLGKMSQADVGAELQDNHCLEPSSTQPASVSVLAAWEAMGLDHRMQPSTGDLFEVLRGCAMLRDVQPGASSSAPSVTGCPQPVHRYQAAKLLSSDGSLIAFDHRGPEVMVAANYDKLRSQAYDLVCAVGSINFGPRHAIKHGDGDDPWYPQRGEWVEWVLGLCDEFKFTPSDVPLSDSVQVRTGLTAKDASLLVDGPVAAGGDYGKGLRAGILSTTSGRCGYHITLEFKSLADRRQAEAELRLARAIDGSNPHPVPQAQLRAHSQLVTLPRPKPLDISAAESLEMEPEEYELQQSINGARFQMYNQCKASLESQGYSVGEVIER